MSVSDSTFAERIIAWQRQHGRQSLPWQHQRDAYRVWLSEVMLQQTQVATVVPYYQRFVQAFPDVFALAAADDERVMQLWSGLGYYSRARNLHRCARQVVERFDGRFPDSVDDLQSLPGIGRSTAAAIAVFAFGQRAAILDGNVKRVFCRHFAVEGFPGERRVEQRLWELVEHELPEHGIEPYTQGLMDLGAGLCTRTRPACIVCPVSSSCRALREGRVDALPTRRARRAPPLRHGTLLIVRDGERVLMQRRPPTGIWGGLWSLPEIGADDTRPLPDEDLSAALAPRIDELSRGGRIGAERLRAATGRAAWLPSFSHAFTHYTLHAQPILIELAPDDGVAEPADDRAVAATGEPAAWRWLAADDLAQAALPTPIRTLLASHLPVRRI
ncbi:MAG: A/G-specific adenine glycosylase [Burkholderiaceae bacterium]